MRHVGRVAALAGAALAIAACTAIAGLDQLHENDCALGCDGGMDGTLDGAEAGDAPFSDVREAEAAPPVDCGPTNTVQNCAGCGNTCTDAESNGASCNGVACSYSGCAPGWGDCDKTPPNTNGCETRTNSTDNCTGCGQRCDTLHSFGASCTGTSCQYTGCQAGWGNCDMTPPDINGCETQTNTLAACGGCNNKCDLLTATDAGCYMAERCTYACNQNRADCNGLTNLPDGAPFPNLDGCECVGSVCCGDAGTACATKHDNGLGQSFYDCADAGTYNVNQANEACAAFDSGACTTSVCLGPDGGISDYIVCNVSGPQCACWEYQGPSIGYVHNSGLPPPANCYCPFMGDPQWN